MSGRYTTNVKGYYSYENYWRVFYLVALAGAGVLAVASEPLLGFLIFVGGIGLAQLCSF